MFIKSQKFKNYLTCETGATAIEYSLIAAGIASVLILTMPTLSQNLQAKYETISWKLLLGS